MREPLVTIVIPVYNVENYLEKCVMSVLTQTYKNLEIFLVDDGSTDNSGSMCDELGKIDDRINVIHKKNGGLSDARNVAIDIMTGEYITFVDSDDWIAEDYIEYLLNLMIMYKADISMVQFKKIYSDTDVINISKEKIEVLSREDAIENYLYQRKFTASAHCKMYKKNLFQSIRYPKGMYYEDMAIICQLIDQTVRVVVSNQQKYYYLQRETSIMGEHFNEKKMHRIIIAQEIQEYIFQKHPNLLGAANFRVFLAAIQTFREIPFHVLYEEYINVAWNEICKYRIEVLKNSKVKKVIKIMAFSSFFGKKVYYILGRLYTKFLT